MTTSQTPDTQTTQTQPATSALSLVSNPEDALEALFGGGLPEAGLDDQQRTLWDDDEPGDNDSPLDTDEEPKTQEPAKSLSEEPAKAAAPEGYEEVLAWVREQKAAMANGGQPTAQAVPPVTPLTAEVTFNPSDDDILEAMQDTGKFRDLLVKATKVGADAALAAMQTKLPDVVKESQARDAAKASIVHQASSEWREANKAFMVPFDGDRLGLMAKAEFEDSVKVLAESGKLDLENPVNLKQQLTSVKEFVAKRYEPLREILSSDPTGGKRVMPSPTPGGGTRRTTSESTNANQPTSKVDLLGSKLVGFSN